MIRSFKPIIDKQCSLLILGSIPGIKSLEANQYYAHPRNQFWKILYTLFDEPYEVEYEKRTAFLLAHHIAVWDVIQHCDREGSLDTAIQNEAVNDFKQLFKEYPSIKTVIFNGDKAHKTFKKYVGFEFEDIAFYKLPSTSPAHTIGFEKKLLEWQILKNV